MKASELRIGNLVGVSWNNIFSTVIEITTDDVKLKDGFATYNQLQPIPLTEEWLLKFGFKKYPDCRDTFQQQYYDSFQFEIDRFTIISFSIVQGFPHLVDCNYNRRYRSEENKKEHLIKYVHQLQNLYFALTNEELTYEQQK